MIVPSERELIPELNAAICGKVLSTFPFLICDGEPGHVPVLAFDDTVVPEDPFKVEASLDGQWQML